MNNKIVHQCFFSYHEILKRFNKDQKHIKQHKLYNNYDMLSHYNKK